MSASVAVADPRTEEAASAGPGRQAVQRFFRHRLAVWGLITVIVLVLVCGFGPYALPWGPLHIDIRARFADPFTSVHVLGTDQLGRDLLVRLLVAGRVSLTVGFAAMALSTVVGTVIGAIAGFTGGLIGGALMRFVDAVLCFPQIFLLLALAAFITPTLASITVVIAATAWMEVARVVEAEMKSLRERDFALAAEVLGASNSFIIFRELLPNAVAPIVVAATLNVARAILLEAYVSFLGYGIQPPTPSWGNMLNNAQEYLATAPWLAIFPGVMIVLAVCGFNFVGDGLRDALDPRAERG